MLRLTHLATCLLAALQISNVVGTSSYQERYLKLAILPEGDYVLVKNYTLKVGEKKKIINDADLVNCPTPHIIGVGPSLSVKVKDFLQYDNITIAKNVMTAVVTRERADHEASIVAEKRCPRPLKKDLLK